MYYTNGSVFVGEFFHGVASGPAHYVLPNGSFYRGKMKKNSADDMEGYF